MGKGRIPLSHEYSFHSGEINKNQLTIEERRDLFKEAFGGSNWNALNYVLDFDADFGIKRRSKNDL